MPVAFVALLLVFEKKLAPHVHRLVEWYAMTRYTPLSVEQAHAARPNAPVVQRPRRWGVTRVVDAQGKRWT